MRSRWANELLQLPVQLHGIRLGRPVDLLLDPVDWRALGFVAEALVVDGDEALREVEPAGATIEHARVSAA